MHPRKFKGSLRSGIGGWVELSPVPVFFSSGGDVHPDAETNDRFSAASWLRGGRDPRWIAAVLGRPVKWVLSCRDHKRWGFEPSPTEVQRHAAAIRATWSEADRIARVSGTNRDHQRSSYGVSGPGIKEYATPSDGSSARLLG